MFINGHTKEGLQSWDARMEAGLGDHAKYRQPRQLHEQIFSGRLTSKQSANVAMPVKQHTECHLAVKIVREREQAQKKAGGCPKQEEQQAYPSISSSSQWDGWWTSSWWDKSRQRTENRPHDGFWQSSSDSDDPRQADIRAESVQTHPHHKPRLSYSTSSFCHSAIVIVQVKLLTCGFSVSRQVSAWCFAHRHYLILLLHCVRFVYCDDSIRKGKSLCVHSTLLTLRTSNTP